MTKKIFILLASLSMFFSFLLINQVYGKMTDDQKKKCSEILSDLLLNKKLISKATFPASKDGIDLNINGTWNNKMVTRFIKEKGVGIEIDEAVTVTTVKLKDDLIEVHLNGGGYGTFADILLETNNSSVSRQKHSAKQAGGSRINLHFGRDITESDLEPDSLIKYLDPLVDASSLRRDAAQAKIPAEFQDAASRKEILPGMDKQTVFAILGEPKAKNVDLDKEPPVEKWQYEMKDLKTMVIRFEGGKVSKVDIF